MNEEVTLPELSPALDKHGNAYLTDAATGIVAQVFGKDRKEYVEQFAQACNSYDSHVTLIEELVKVVADMVSELDCWTLSDPCPPQTCDKEARPLCSICNAKAALAKAKEQNFGKD
jgi:hypothetical protein